MPNLLAEQNKHIQPVVNKTVVPLRSLRKRKILKNNIYELLSLERLLRKYDSDVDTRIEHTIRWDGQPLPIYFLFLGNATDDSVSTLLLTGGVNRVERIGTQVVLS